MGQSIALVVMVSEAVGVLFEQVGGGFELLVLVGGGGFDAGIFGLQKGLFWIVL